jgi:hypothetical protein
MRLARGRFLPRKRAAVPASPPLGAERVGGEVGEPPVPDCFAAHLTLPVATATGPSLSPLKGGEGQKRDQP